MRTVKLYLKDKRNGADLTRTIDAVNAMRSGVHCWELGDEDDQRARLERWIEERGNEQHATELRLVRWEFPPYDLLNSTKRYTYHATVEHIGHTYSVVIQANSADEAIRKGRREGWRVLRVESAGE